MGGFVRTSTLLTIYLFIGIFGPSFGLDNTILDDMFKQTLEKPGLLGGILQGIDFIFGIVFLPIGVLSPSNPIIIIIIIEFISLLNLISIAMYIRGI